MTTPYVRRQVKGNVSYQDYLTSGINNTALSFTLHDGSTFPDGSVGPFVVTIDPNSASEEKVLCQSRSGSTVTVATGGRGWDNTTAVAHSAGGPGQVIHSISAVDLDEANQTVVATLGKIAAAGDLLVGTGANALEKLAKGAANQVLTVGGADPSGLEWAALPGVTAATIEALFTANKQIFLGTGSGTGELIDLLAALELEFGAKGQLLVGTGAGTGALLGVGSDGQVLTADSTQADGVKWATSGIHGESEIANFLSIGSGNLISVGTSAAELSAAFRRIINTLPSGVSCYFEATFLNNATSTTVQLYDVTAGAVVTNGAVSTSSGTFVPVRSTSPVTLVAGHTYSVAAYASSSANMQISAARLVGVF